MRRSLILVHRWTALVIGLVLVTECTTGAVLLYQGELFRTTNSALYRHTSAAQPMAPTDAIAVVNRAHPDFHAIWVAEDGGVYAVGEATYRTQYFVDPGTGHINGLGNLNSGFLGLMANLHECALSCEGLPGYNAWFATELWHDGPSFLHELTRGAVLLGGLGLILIVIMLTSIPIWWPGRRRLRARVTVRRGRGRFPRDTDLHNLIGAIALPFLLMWGITGAAFEFPVVEKAWLAITGDVLHEEEFALTPHKVAAGTPTITAAQATDVARAAVPGSSASFIGLPSKDFTVYEIDLISSYASYRYRALYSGDAYVLVDPHDASHYKVIEGGRGPLANRFYDKFLEPTHFGMNVNAWWRILWLVFGLSPLALMATGMSTWLYKRGVRKRRRTAAAATAVAATAAAAAATATP